MINQYGNPSTATSLTASGEVSYEQLVSALKRSPEGADGQATKATNGHAHADGRPCSAWAAQDKGGEMAPFSITRRAPRADDVVFQITHCGICHSDLHQIKDEWGNTVFPIVPGHELVGFVTEVGANVSEFKVGDRVGVGCMVNSCRTCSSCEKGEEQFCENGATFTYNSQEDGKNTYGGYSTSMVVHKDFTLRIPENLPLAGAAPLLCAGITTFSPLKYFKLDQPGTKLGVVGLGGLGHMAVQLGKAMGCEVTVISTSEKKKDEAVNELGADHFIVSKDAEQMKAAAASLDGIIDTVSAQHPVMDYMALLRTDGRMVCVGVPPENLEIHASSLVFGRKTLSGSLIGGIKETQEMLDFCGKHNITSFVEVVPITYLNKAMERLVKNDVHYRFVIDIQGSLIQ